MSDLAAAVRALPPLREIIRDHGLRAEKKLGQNFLLDLNLTSKIARVAGDAKGRLVFEIGPGPGGLTRGILCEDPDRLIAIEYDGRAVEALQTLRQAAGDRLEILQQDALASDLLTEGKRRGYALPYRVIANLPYNIATPLLAGWLADLHQNPLCYDALVLMFQKEVAQRIVAKPGSKAYGRLAVISQWLCDCKIAFDVPSAAFTPPPKVTSSVVRFIPKEMKADMPAFATVEKLTAAAFGQRRKMIRSSLKNHLHEIELCGLRPEARAEELSVADFIALARMIEKEGGKGRD